MRGQHFRIDGRGIHDRLERPTEHGKIVGFHFEGSNKLRLVVVDSLERGIIFWACGRQLNEPLF